MRKKGNGFVIFMWLCMVVSCNFASYFLNPARRTISWLKIKYTMVQKAIMAPTSGKNKEI